jgi:hypothetical protein
MKDYRFDELSKELAAAPLSRRRALKLLLAGAGAGLLSAVAAPDAYAARKCREIGQTCQSDAQCCTRFCDNSSFRCACPGTVCDSGQCLVCEAPKVVDNPTSCQCVCPTEAAEACTQAGGQLNQNTCECACPAGKVLSGEQCVCLQVVTCPSGQTFNPATCECECATPLVTCGTATCACGEICCPPGTTRAGQCRGTLTACR